MQLSDEQKDVIQGIFKNSGSPGSVVTLGGYAGSGKTTVIQHLYKVLNNYAVAAFTGKAANVLRRKGLPGQTIHSLIYVPEKDEYGNIVIDSAGCPVFVLNPSLEYEGVIIDEASMVGTEIYKDLCSFNKPLIFVGDHGQLEPVGDGGMNMMKNPDFKLETIHRNAGEIAHFAEHIRNGFRPASWQFKGDGKVRFVNKFKAGDYFLQVDQIICAYNKTRVQVNMNVRRQLGFRPEWPVEGDRVMCLRNDKQRGLFNGMQGVIVKVWEKPKNKMIFRSEDQDYEVSFDPTQFNKDKYDFSHNRDDPPPFDYAYCITAHKSQGDEWGKVMVLEQKCKLWDHKRWAYTAASRAKEEVIWVESY